MTTPQTTEPRRTGGRRSKLTPETHEAIVKAVKAGASFENAAQAAGIDESTLYRWLRDGETEDASEVKRQFREDLYRAHAEVEVRVVAASVMKSALGGYVIEETTVTKPDGTVETRVKRAPADGRVGLDLLARRDPARWARRSPVEISGPGGGPIQVQATTIQELSARLHEELAGLEDAVDAELVDESEE
jgi:transposase-like protein